MARELFQAVQTAEDKADLLIQEAQKDARDLLKAAQAEIDGNERNVTLEHRAMYQSILEEKRKSVGARIAAARPDVEKAQSETVAQARTRLEKAAQRIFERVWNDGDR
jgi:vacuolar-type H+-ATPase subunit H